MRGDDDQLREDLAATSESLRGHAERLVEIEREKETLDGADARVDVLSNEAERLAGRIQQESRIERDLADDLPEDGKPPGHSN
jgi:hypothetical protein